MSGALLLLTTVGAPGSHASAGIAAQPCGALFEDFDYRSTADAAFRSRGWQVRTDAGKPGVDGATWSAANVTFETVDDQNTVRLTASTDGTGQGTTQAEIIQAERRFLEGTYAARVRFADAPATGPDGDTVVQTFYAVSPLAHDNDPLYSELDFSEYLPNGGWGTSTPTNSQTSWHTAATNPPTSKNKTDSQEVSLDGWHIIAATVGEGHVKYYLDGVLVADHDRVGLDVYPRQAMSLNFSQWFAILLPRAGEVSTYHQHVDWVYHAKNEVLSPAQVIERTAGFRRSAVTFKDDLAKTCGTPTSSPAPTATTTPVTTTPVTPPQSAPPTTSEGAAAPVSDGAGSEFDLATTGTSTEWMVLTGAAMTGLGVGLILLVRRRRV